MFENEKIKISFSTGSVSNDLSVYLIDTDGKSKHILWEIFPSSHQNFDKTNEKIKSFVEDKIDEWISDEKSAEKLRQEAIQQRERKEEAELKKLIDSF